MIILTSLQNILSPTLSSRMSRDSMGAIHSYRDDPSPRAQTTWSNTASGRVRTVDPEWKWYGRCSRRYRWIKSSRRGPCRDDVGKNAKEAW